MIRIEPDQVDSVRGIVQSVMEKHPERITGTAGCRAAAEDMADELKKHCDSAGLEAFEQHPSSLWNMGRIVALAYVLSIPLLALGGWFVPAAAALLLISVTYAVSTYIFYGKLFDGLFKKAEGLNAVGVIEPESAAERQVIVSGHHDSTFVFNFLARFEAFAGIRFLLAIAFCVFAALLSVYAAIRVLTNGSWNLDSIWLILLAAGAVFVVPLFFFFSRRISPGAGDNLIGSAIALGAAAYFGGRKKAGEPLGHTRLVFVSCDGEEAGQRGSQEYAALHGREMRELPTFVLNIDSIYRLCDLAAMKSDRHGLTPLSPRTARSCVEIARELGYSVAVRAFPFGGGGTDAASFAKKGAKAVSLVAMPTSLFGSRHFYHTPEDTLENIEPEAVKAVLEIVINYVLEADKKSF